jgi:hypothetical protein
VQGCDGWVTAKMMIILHQRYGINLLLMRNCTLLTADCVCVSGWWRHRPPLSYMIIIALMRESEFVCAVCKTPRRLFGSPSALHAWCFAMEYTIYTQPRRVSQYLDSWCSLLRCACANACDCYIYCARTNFFIEAAACREKSRSNW